MDDNIPGEGRSSRMHRLISNPLGLKAAVDLLRETASALQRSIESNAQEHKMVLSSELDRINNNIGEFLKQLADVNSSLGTINEHVLEDVQARRQSEKILGDMNLSLGTINEHILEDIQTRQRSEKSVNDEISKIVASIGNMNNNITQLFGSLIELDRNQKALIARLEMVTKRP